MTSLYKFIIKIIKLRNDPLKSDLKEIFFLKYTYFTYINFIIIMDLFKKN